MQKVSTLFFFFFFFFFFIIGIPPVLPDKVHLDIIVDSCKLIHIVKNRGHATNLITFNLNTGHYISAIKFQQVFIVAILLINFSLKFIYTISTLYIT